MALTTLNPFPAIYDNVCLLSHVLMFFGSHFANNVDPDQTDALGQGPVWWEFVGKSILLWIWIYTADAINMQHFQDIIY